MFQLIGHTSVFRLSRFIPKRPGTRFFKTSCGFRKVEDGAHQNGKDAFAKKLKDKGLTDLVDVFKKNAIDDKSRGYISPKSILQKLDIKDTVVRSKTEQFLTKEGFADSYIQRHRGKVFNDPVHGHIELPPLCVAIIDTPQFQRLRYLKQMGTCDFVFSGAVHTRFEHSLGVCHLAGFLIKHLRRLHPSLDITDEDVLCVQIAGLCHDMGHGPFSHMFDNIFVPLATGGKREHEEASIAMFDYMYNDPANNLVSKFEKYGLTETDRIFIKEQIAGPRAEETNEQKYEGRPGKTFLYDIVANERNGIDVDKWDYISRDCLHLGIKSNFDHHRFTHFARVIPVGDSHEPQICLRDKEAYGIDQMYQTRYFVHKIACLHRITSATSFMIADALKDANEVIMLPKANGDMVKISDCIKKDNLDAFTNLTDEVIRHIVTNPDPRLKTARKILRDIWHRKLYMFVGESPPTSTLQFEDRQKIKEEILQFLPHECSGRRKIGDHICQDQVIVELVNFNFGKKNPLESIKYYSKEKPDDAKSLSRHQVTSLVRRNFKEQVVRVFLKPSGSDDEKDKNKRESLRLAFGNWCLAKEI